jgi:hypothetical protein
LLTQRHDRITPSGEIMLELEERIELKSLPYFAGTNGKFVVTEEPVTLRIGRASAAIRLEQQ